MNIIGLFNIQYVVSNNEVFVIEVNPRSSRTVPLLSKITNVPMANLATKVILGQKLKDYGLENGLVPEKAGVFVKVPVFSFAKLRQVEITLGPEMKSTGEVLGKDDTLQKALYKGLIASGIQIKQYGTVLLTVADKDKEEAVLLAERFNEIGYQIIATEGTAQALDQANIPCQIVGKFGSEEPNLLDVIQ